MILAAVRRISADSGNPSQPALHGTQEYLQRKAYVRHLAQEALKRLGAAALRETDPSAEEPILLKHDAAGRPFLCVSDSDRVLFQPGFCSLSHSGDALLAVVSDMPVGCDIERMLRGDYPFQALRGFFSESDLRRLPHPVEREAFSLALTRLWTRKEAVYKLAGKLPRDSLCLSDEECTRKMLGITFEERIMEDRFALTIALKGNKSSVRWTDISE